MKRQLERVIERLLSDEMFLERFRQDPAAAVRSYGLKADEIDALKRGDAAELAQLGVNVDRYQADPPSPARSVWMGSPVGRRALALLSALVMTLGVGLLSAAPAAAAGRFSSVRRVRARRLQGRMVRMVGRALRQRDVRAGRYLKRHARHLGLRYVKNGDGADNPCPCVEPIQ